MKTLLQVKEFHDTFGHPAKDAPDLSDKKLNALRIDLIREELEELKEALDNNDVTETFDALCDLQYVLDGAFLALGLHKAKLAGIDEVHSSNMSKLGEDGKPVVREDGKILKGPNYYRPDLKKVLLQVFGAEKIAA